MLRIAVCDDEKSVLTHTTEMLQNYKKTSVVVDCYESGEALLASAQKYDLILLDIDMQGLDGIKTAEHIRMRDREVKLIYVTNYSDYMTFAFAVHAFAYLLKPLSEEELFRQLDEAAAYGAPATERELEFVAKEGICHIRPSEILFFEYGNFKSGSRMVRLHTAQQDWHLKKKIAEVATEMAEYDFVMPHKSFVVNLYAVQSIHGYDICLSDGSLVPLSQKKSAEFRRKLNCYLAGEGGLRR